MSKLSKNDKLEIMKMALEASEALISSVRPEDWTKDEKKEAEAIVKEIKKAIVKEIKEAIALESKKNELTQNCRIGTATGTQ